MRHDPDSILETDSIIDRVKEVLIYCQYGKTILMADEKIGYHRIYLQMIILIV